MPLLTRDAILSADDQRSEDVAVPEWGGHVRVAVVSGTERDRYELTREKRKGPADEPGLRATLVAMCAVGEDGKKLFAVEDVAALGRKNGFALDRVFQACLRVNGLTDDAIEDRAGNSESGQSDDSGTSSPERS